MSRRSTIIVTLPFLHPLNRNAISSISIILVSLFLCLQHQGQGDEGDHSDGGNHCLRRGADGSSRARGGSRAGSIRRTSSSTASASREREVGAGESGIVGEVESYGAVAEEGCRTLESRGISI